MGVAVTAFGLLGWLLYEPLGLGSAQVTVAAAGLTGVVLIIASSIPIRERKLWPRLGHALVVAGVDVLESERRQVVTVLDLAPVHL